jgi:hypothetical protein
MPRNLVRAGLETIFVGVARDPESSRVYSDPETMFWDLLAASGLTAGERIGPGDDAKVLSYGIGLVDLGLENRADPGGDLDVPRFLAEIEALEPRVVAFNGGYPARRVARYLREPPPPEGPISWRVGRSLAYRLPSAAPDKAAPAFAVKRNQWVAFGEWVRAAR